jgi:long-chain fatty acid transport protein
MSRRLRNVPLLTAMVVVLYCGAAMAGGWQYSAVGARAKAMGGAYRALSDDWSGVYYNPAGLAFLANNVATVTAETDNPRPEVTPNFTIDGYGFGYLDGQTRYPNKDQVMLWGAGSMFVRPTSTSPLVFGMAVYQSFDNNADMDLFYLRPAYDDIVTVSPTNHNSNLDVVVFHPAVAYKLAEDRFSIGVGVPIYRGDVRLDQIRLVDNPYSYILNVRPYEKFPKLFTVDGYGYGVGVNVGLQFRPNDKFSIGASYASSAKIKMDGDSREIVYLPHNAGVVNLYNDPKANEYEKEILTTYSGGTFRAESTFDLDMKLPSEFGVGIAFQASEKVKLAADFDYVRWSEFQDFDIKISNRVIDRSVYATWRTLFSDFYIPFQWDDKFRISVGGEGIINERWTVRAGYMYDQSPIPDQTFNEIFMDTGDKHHFMLGACFRLNETLSFDGAVEAVFASSRTIDVIDDVNGDGYWDNFGGTFKNKGFSSTWALNYSF